MKPLSSDLIIKTYDIYLDIAKEYVSLVDNSKFSSETYLSKEGKIIKTPKIMDIKLRGYDLPFGNLYMTPKGVIWEERVVDYRFTYRKFSKKNRQRLYELVPKIHTPLAFRLKNDWYDAVNMLCLLTYLHGAEFENSDGDYFTEFYPEFPREEQEIRKNIMLYLINGKLNFCNNINGIPESNRTS